MTTSVRALDRGLDLLVGVAALVLFGPALLLIATLVKLTSRGPALYRATRVGLGGKPFTLYKFRTMIVGADKRGPRVAARGDARVTRLGAFLRRAKLDELPQLFNVVRGDMRLVGPRPEDPWFVRHYTPEQLRVLSVPPGLTSPASISYRHEDRLMSDDDSELTYSHLILPRKLEMELRYLDRRSVASDLWVLLRTAVAVVDGAVRRGPQAWPDPD